MFRLFFFQSKAMVQGWTTVVYEFYDEMVFQVNREKSCSKAKFFLESNFWKFEMTSC